MSVTVTELWLTILTNGMPPMGKLLVQQILFLLPVLSLLLIWPGVL